MITQKDAEGIAARLLGRRSDDGQQPWELEEFDQGWVVVELDPHGGGMRGGATDVVERETGHLVRFPSSVGADWIMEEYPVVRERGHEVQGDGG